MRNCRNVGTLSASLFRILRSAAEKFNNLLFLRFGLIFDFRQLGDETGGASGRSENSNRRFEWSLFYVPAFRFCSLTLPHRSARYLLRNSFCPFPALSTLQPTVWLFLNLDINVLCFSIDYAGRSSGDVTLNLFMS